MRALTGSRRGFFWVFSSSVAALGFVVACTSAVPRPVAGDAALAAARWPAVQLTDLEDGRTLYLRKCGGCHRLYPPNKFSPERWQASMVEMSEKAGIGSEDRLKLEAYLWSVSSRPEPVRH